MGGLAGDGFVVVARVVVPAETAPVLGHDPAHRCLLPGQDLQPEKHRPEAIFFADVVAARAETFLTAKGDAPRIEQVAEEFPARWRFEAGQTKLLCHHIGGGAGGHRASHTG